MLGKVRMKIFFLVFLLTTTIVHSQVLKPISFNLTENESPVERILSNSVIDIQASDGVVWFATGKGVSKTPDGGDNWFTYTRDHGLGKGGISALAVRDSIIWVATAFDTTVGVVGAGGGLSYSTDGGNSWTWMPQPVDSRGDTLGGMNPTTTNVDNITYDIALTDSTVWIASFGGGLRKYSYANGRWEVIPPDDKPFSVWDNLNHRAFSVATAEESIWVGTADGLNKSTDGGESWDNYNSQNGIPGDWVTGQGVQRWGEREILWAACWPTDESEYYGVAKSENGGLSWQTTLTGEKVYNFGFQDSVVYTAAESGLWKSADGGLTWGKFPPMVDHQNGDRIYSDAVYAVFPAGNTLWVGTGDGVAKSDDLGYSWTIYRSFVPAGRDGQPSTYAYPNPFSPARIGDLPPVRFQYRTTATNTLVTMKVYNFALEWVRTVVENRQRLAPGDYAEIWDGRDDDGRIVANGVYFYQLIRNGREDWGKVMVLD